MIHKTAIIDPKAKINSDVKIGPYCVIGPNVEIGKNSIIQSHVSILGYTKIGENNNIYPFASIGNDPQDLKFKGEQTKLEIGNNNKIREYVTINKGTDGGGGLTKIGNNCLFMVSSHIAHDCLVEDNVILANNVPLGGHAHIEQNVIIGGNSAVQQFTRIGKFAMIGGMCGVVRDVIPYGIDQVVFRKISKSRFAFLQSLLPATAMCVGIVALQQRPSVEELFGVSLIIFAIVLRGRGNEY